MRINNFNITFYISIFNFKHNKNIQIIQYIISKCINVGRLFFHKKKIKLSHLVL